MFWNIKWVHTVPPKSKLQDQTSKLQDPNPKIKTPRPKPPKSKLQNPNPQNQNSKIQNLHQFLVHDRSPPKKMSQYIFLANHQHNEQNINMEISKKNLAIGFFPLKIHETGKMNEKKFARVSPRPIGPEKNVKKMILQAMYFFLPLWLLFSVAPSSVFGHVFFTFFIFLGWTNSSRDAQGLNFKTQIKNNI